MVHKSFTLIYLSIYSVAEKNKVAYLSPNQSQ